MKMVKRITALVTALIMMTAILASCGSQTLEQYIEKDAESFKEVQTTAENAGMELSVKDNDIIFTVDVKNLQEYSDDLIESGVVAEEYSKRVDSAAAIFTTICSSYEKETGIDGIRTVIIYNYGDKELFTKTFTSQGLQEE